MNYNTKIGLVLLIAMIGIISVIAIPPIAQDPNYHSFVDKRCIASIPNFWNVVTNIPFLIIGAFGMIIAVLRKPAGMLPELSINVFVFFLGIFFCCIGSIYYHYHPTTESLFWDRLPMTVSFMAFFSIIIGEHISIKAGKLLLPQFLLIGIISILYWNMTEREGVGDLRFYGLVQFLPMVLIPLIVLIFKSKFNTNIHLWFVALSYAVAKLLEYFDYPVFACGNLISGHSLKHLSAALAPIMYLIALYKRKHQLIISTS